MRRGALAVTMGDPAGIGPEIIGRAWDALKADGPAFVVIGDYEALVSGLGARSRTAVRRVTDPAAALDVFPDALPVIDQPLTEAVVAGKPSPGHAPAVIRWIDTAVGLALSGTVCGIVTAPIAKAPLYAAGFKFPGHTEYLAELTSGAAYIGTRGPVMMLATPGLRTVLTTIHEPLSRVPGLLTLETVARTALVAHEALQRDFDIAMPRLMMAALNPHAGEGGSLGREEIDVLIPAARALRGAGIDCAGPRPADSLFHSGVRKTYDAILCHYHDQALIPLKTIDFWGGVNITLGLPIVRTSPDHGTAFDIAGRGIARADSLIAAIRAAAEIANSRHRT